MRGRDAGKTGKSLNSVQQAKLQNVKEDGFSVLEAIMAVAILSIALLPLMNLQSQFVKTVESYERVQERVAIEKQVLERMTSINIGAFPEGQEPFGDFTLVWSTSEVDIVEATQYPPASQYNNISSLVALYNRHEKSRDRFGYRLQPTYVRLVNKTGQSAHNMILYKFAWQVNYSFLESVF